MAFPIEAPERIPDPGFPETGNPGDSGKTRVFVLLTEPRITLSALRQVSRLIEGLAGC